MMKRWLLFVVACFVFGFSLLAHVPARLVVPEHIDKLQFLGIGGSVWRGEIQQVLYSGKAIPIRGLMWTVKPVALLTGTLAADLYEQQTPVNRGSLGMNLLSRQVELRTLHWQFSAASLDSWFQAWIRLRGNFMLELQTLRLLPNERFPNQLQGRLDWQNAALQINSESYPVGSPVLQFSGEGGAMNGVVTNSQPLLPGDGSFECTVESCRVEMNLQPTPDAPESLLNGLVFLGLQKTGDAFSGQMTFPLWGPLWGQSQVPE